MHGTRLTLSPLLFRFAGGDSLHTIRIWDIATLECEGLMRVSNDIVCAVAFANDKLVTSSFGAVKVWDLGSKACLKTITKGLQHWVRALEVDADAGLVYGVGHNKVRHHVCATCLPWRFVRHVSATSLSTLPESLLRSFNTSFFLCAPDTPHVDLSRRSGPHMGRC